MVILTKLLTKKEGKTRRKVIFKAPFHKRIACTLSKKQKRLLRCIFGKNAEQFWLHRVLITAELVKAN